MDPETRAALIRSYPCRIREREQLEEEEEETMLTFGQALEEAQKGKRVARTGWNGKGMWITYSPGQLDLPAEKFWAFQNQKFAALEHGGKADVLPCLTMKTADGKILMGWLASQSDMLSCDWVVVE